MHSVPIPSLTPQEHHKKMAEIHARACKHHTEAARLYACDDAPQADIHASIAHRHAVAALGNPPHKP